MAKTSALSTFVNIFASPNEAFAAIKERPRAWLPLLIVILGYCAVTFTYLHVVDLRWLMDSQLATNAPQLTDAQRQQAVERAVSIGPTVYGAISAIAVALVMTTLFAVAALYYTAVSFFSGDGLKFWQWFGLVTWCALPTLFGIVAQLVNLAATDARFLVPDALDPLAFGNLFSIDRTGATMLQRRLLGVDVTALWSLALVVLAYQAWTKTSLLRTITVVFAPLVVIVAIGTAIAFL
jgi:hypothetical protein